MKLNPSVMRIARQCRRSVRYHRTPQQRAELRAWIISNIAGK